MNPDPNLVSGEERIVKVREIVDGKETVFWAIRDMDLDYWRSIHPLYEYNAWTRDRRQRAEFRNRGDAIEEVLNIRRFRAGVFEEDLDADDAECLAA